MATVQSAQDTPLTVTQWRALQEWIEHNVDRSTLWRFTSLGLTELFTASGPGFEISHGHMKHAMRAAGHFALNEQDDIWIFA